MKASIGAYLPVVVDTGSYSVKAGFGGEEAPREVQRTLVGHPRHPGVSGGMVGSQYDTLCGAAAVAQRGVLTMGSPMDRGRVGHWEDAEALWRHTLATALQAPPEEHPLLMTETPDNTRADRERLATAAFESLNAPALVVMNTSALALFATGRSTGLVVESGAGRTHIGPVWEGYAMPHHLTRIDYAGEDLTARLLSMLRNEGYAFSTEQDRDAARSLKESLCYVAGDPEFERAFCHESRAVEKLFRLPDGQEVYMNEARFLAPEVLMSPSYGAGDGVSAHLAASHGWAEGVRNCIEACDAAIRPELYAAVVLGGGNTLFPRLEERLQRSVSLLAPKGAVTKCVAFRNREYAAWIGGSVIGSLSTFPSMWVSKAEYDEHGASLIHRKTH